MLFGGCATPIWVAGVKVNGMENGAVVTVGPTNTGGMQNFVKSQQWNQLFGDAGYAPTGWGTIVDTDLYDQPIFSSNPAIAPNLIGW